MMSLARKRLELTTTTGMPSWEINKTSHMLVCHEASYMWRWLSSIMTHHPRWKDWLSHPMLIDRFWAHPTACVFPVGRLLGWYHVVWPWHNKCLYLSLSVFLSCQSCCIGNLLSVIGPKWLSATFLSADDLIFQNPFKFTSESTQWNVVQAAAPLIKSVILSYVSAAFPQLLLIYKLYLLTAVYCCCLSVAAYSEPADYLNSVKIKLWDPQQCFLQCFLTVTPALPEWQSHHWQEMMTLNYFTLHHITTATYLRRLVSMSRDGLCLLQMFKCDHVLLQ